MAAERSAIACFGEALIDFLARPQPAGAPRQFVEHAGGAPANVAVGVARLGGDARFVGMLGLDMFGDALLAQFIAHGVDVAQVKRTDEARTALAFVSLDPQGERSFSFYRPPAADLLFHAADFDPAAFDTTAVFHVCSNSLTEPEIAETTLHGMRLASERGALVSMDLNLRPALWPRGVDPTPTLWRALSLADLVKLSHEELVYLAAGEAEGAVLARLLAAGVRAVVVTDGPAPIRWWTSEASGTAHTFAVEARDTTAAGDAFVAGLLQRLVARGVDREGIAAAFEDAVIRHDLLRHAAAAGALATTRHGAFDAMPSASDVRALLETAA
jgi:fructokinase